MCAQHNYNAKIIKNNHIFINKMKNLELWNVSREFLDIDSDKHIAVTYGNNMNSTGNMYVCTYNLILKFIENGVIKWTKSLHHIASSDNAPLNIEYLSLLNTICVGLQNGELLTVPDDGSSCSVVGVCEHGLQAMQWSPDQELLVMVTKDMRAILMSCTYDAIREVDLWDQDFGRIQFVTVGWGKKETQFHGSEGKQAAKIKNEVFADPTIATDKSIKISWRGDGVLYAISFTIDGIRVFKVFDREGHVQYTSEKHQGLESNLSWRPSGNLIATTQKQTDKYMVSFFEKNGLKHGDFIIPVHAYTHVENISWSNDSEILSLQCKDSKTHTQMILLFTNCNYHWYLKQTLLFNNTQKICNTMWDNHFNVANNKKLYILLENGHHYCYTWIWSVHHSRGIDDHDNAIVTSIDAHCLLTTGFRQTVVPPPMSACKIEVPNPVNSVHFAPPKKKSDDYDTNTFFVCTVDHKMIFYEQTSKFPLEYKILKSLELDLYEFPYQYNNWHWLSKDILLCVMVDKNNSCYLVEWSMDTEKLLKKHVASLPAPAVRIESHPTLPLSIFIEQINGDIVQYDIGGTITPQAVSFDVACPYFKVLNVDNKIYFLGLAHKGQLYINETKVIHNVSSFFVHTHFLLLTTLQHVLLCTKLTSAGIESLKEYATNESPNVYKRKIERGAKLIVAVPNDTRTIFQMPRGNIEAIQPRPLSLKIIGECLDSLKYHEAFDLMRKQRINLNLIYDHDQEKLINNINVFLETIQNNSWLCLFLSDLDNVDVTETMYSSSYNKKKYDNKLNGSKVSKVCDLIRINILERNDKSSKILPLLTTFVKKNTDEDLEKALQIVKDLKKQESCGSKLPVGSDEALKYLLYMVEVNKLFDVALGMYDFDLVLLVANKSQKDPKEFIPMLNELNEMEDNLKKFSINKHLKRFDKAVEFLAKCGSNKHNELKSFVKYHSLYKEALKLFSKEDTIYKEISDDYGLYLKSRKHLVEAGIIYERAGCIDKAVECYKEALEWELALKLAANWPGDKMKKLCWELTCSLNEQKRTKEALVILEHFYGSIDDAIVCAIENGHFKTAIRLCASHNKDELRDQHLLPAILSEYLDMQKLIEKNWNDFTAYKTRLRIVREEKLKNPIESFDTFASRDCDLYSDIGSTLGSTASRSSGRSYRSSKNRRKHERKIASLKEGSQYEDIAIIMALHTLINGTFDLRSPVKEINISLSWFNKEKEAFILQTSLEKILKDMKDSFREIWTNEFMIEAANASIAAQNVVEGHSVIPQGLATLETHFRIAPLVQEVDWKLDGLNA